MKIFTKLFVSKKQRPKSTATPQEIERTEFNSERIRGKEVAGFATDNWVHLTMDMKYYSTKSTSLVSGGNYDFHEDDLPGYKLRLSFLRDEEKLKKVVVKILRANGFGCFLSRGTTQCHKEDKSPSRTDAQNILTRVCESISNEVESFARVKPYTIIS